MMIYGWGRYPKTECKISRPRTQSEVTSSVYNKDAIAFGNGRSYGDSALSVSNTIDMNAFNCMESFDEDKGILICEAGVLLKDIIQSFLPRGWFPLVTPGTQYVSVGGMIAADVHGKNHHKQGSFRSCVQWFDLLCEDGEIKRCSATKNKKLFEFTSGGMGLTGIILKAAIKLQPVETGWIKQEIHMANSLDEMFDIFDASNDWTYSVAWIDCFQKGNALGRGAVMLGEHASLEDLKNSNKDIYLVESSCVSIPFSMPSFLLNRYTIKLFNALYFNKNKRKLGEHLIDWKSYFYPLDSLLNWNRLYGEKGFVQYQFVLPLETSRQGLKEILKVIAQSNQGSFLSVLKKFGGGEKGISFPMEGYTLALDFPVSNKVFELLKVLDKLVLKNNGRFYLAKDARLDEEVFSQSEQRLASFKNFRKEHNKDEFFNSQQSKRLNL